MSKWGRAWRAWVSEWVRWKGGMWDGAEGVAIVARSFGRTLDARLSALRRHLKLSRSGSKILAVLLKVTDEP